MSKNLPDYSSNVIPMFESAEVELLAASDGGGKGGDGMEPRIAKLEADMDHVKRQLGEVANRVASIGDKQTDQRVEFLVQFSNQKSGSDANFAEIRTDIAVIKEKLTHLPSKTFAIASAVAIVAAVSALILFGERLQQLLGI